MGMMTEGAAVARPGPMTEQVDPSDLSASYNTPLTPQQERAFKKWQAQNPRLGSTYDYDARGFWLNGAKQGGNGHGADAWKKPNHPTFSSESIYAGPQTPGGTWKQMSDGSWAFIASPANLKYRSPEELDAYFQRIEPGAILILPDAGEQK